MKGRPPRKGPTKARLAIRQAIQAIKPPRRTRPAATASMEKPGLAAASWYMIMASMYSAANFIVWRPKCMGTCPQIGRLPTSFLVCPRTHGTLTVLYQL